MNAEPTKGAMLRQLVNLRDDAALQKLSDQQWEEIAHLVATGMTFTRFKNWLKASGIALSAASISRNGDRLRAAGDRLLKRNAAMALIRDEAKRRGITITEAALEQGAVAVGDIIDGGADPESEAGKKLIIAGYSALSSGRAVEQRDAQIDLKRDELKLAERKVAALEQKVADAKQVVESKALSADEQRKRLKEIFAK